MAEQDDLYDTSWTPPQEVEILIKSCGYTPYGEGPEEEEYSEENALSYENYVNDENLSSKGL
jgi:hypothetical protein